MKPVEGVLFEDTPERLVEYAGRVCYKSEDKIGEGTAEKLINTTLKPNHHWSVMEHSQASFHIVCDRGVSHEIVRHRIASYSQESTRYCNYSKDKFGGQLAVVEPPFVYAESLADWSDVVVHIETTYNKMIARGEKPQIARSVLPTSLKTEMVMTCNFREWNHFLALRTSAAAHPQIREVATMVGKILHAECPIIFAPPTV
jgi:thymidylate synthase (FAD)